MHLPDYDYMYILDLLKYMCFCTDLSIVHLYQILSNNQGYVDFSIIFIINLLRQFPKTSWEMHILWLFLTNGNCESLSRTLLLSEIHLQHNSAHAIIPVLVGSTNHT